MRKSTEGQPLIFATAQEQEFDASMPSSNGLSKSLTGVVFEPTSVKMLGQKHQTRNYFTIGPATAVRPEQPRLIWACCIRTTDLAFFRLGPSIRTIDRVIRPKISRFIRTVDRVYPILSGVLLKPIYRVLHNSLHFSFRENTVWLCYQRPGVTP